MLCGAAPLSAPQQGSYVLSFVNTVSAVVVHCALLLPTSAKSLVELNQCRELVSLCLGQIQFS